MADIKAKLPVANDGIYDLADNPIPSTAGVIGSSRAATIDETTMNQRVTATPGDNDKIAMDVAISDSSGNHITENNPLPVYQAESPGAEVDEYDEAVDVVKDNSANHDYTVTAAKTMKLIEMVGSASGLAKFELQVETAAASGTFNTVATRFNSVSNPQARAKYKLSVAAGVIVRVVKTNLDNRDMSIYSEIKGVEL